MLSEDWEQADRAFVRDVDIHPALEPYRARYLQHCGRIYRGFGTPMRILLRQQENDDYHHQRVHAPGQEVEWPKLRTIVQCTSGNAAPPTTPCIMTMPVDRHRSPDTAAGKTGAGRES